LCTGCIASRWEGGKKLKLKKAPMPALPPFLLSQENAGVQARG
jgi:hypothetical protein